VVKGERKSHRRAGSNADSILISISLTHYTSGVTQEPPQSSFIWLFGAPKYLSLLKTWKACKSLSDLSCLAVSFTGMLAFISCFFHGSLVGFVAARNWSSRSLRSATSWQSCIASVLAAPSSSRSIAYLERLFCMWLFDAEHAAL
jgi:hypothetical protein